MLLKDALPQVAQELAHGFHLEGRDDLAEQVAQLELVDRCSCTDDFCASFYTQPRMSWEGKKVERFILRMPGLFCLNTVNGVVAHVELLQRPEVRERLRELFPQGFTERTSVT
jgi:hypothetical protein